MSHEYEVEYGQDGKAQINRVPQQSHRTMPQDQGGYYQQPPYGYPPYKEPFRLPAVVNTCLLNCIGCRAFLRCSALRTAVCHRHGWWF